MISLLFVLGLPLSLRAQEPPRDLLLRPTEGMCSGPGVTAAEGRKKIGETIARAMAAEISSLVSPIRTSSSAKKTVRIVYLVPADSVENPDYTYSLGRAIEHLQIWYRNQIGNGKAFNLSSPLVEVHRTPHNSAWYSINPNGDLFVQFWNNVLQDGFALTGGAFNDPDNIWLFYVDADPMCGQCGGCGGGGVVVIGANDLRGLVGGPWLPTCTGENFTFQPCRFVGGLGHELGHAFGLPHPPGCDQREPSCDGGALMWAGFYGYPNSYLRADEIAHLNQHPFFEHVDLTTELFDCDNLLPLTMPDAPVLYYPVDGASGVPVNNVVLRWAKASGAASYDYEVAKSSDFSAITHRGTLAGRHVGLAVENGTIYYWHVRASNTAGVSDWSPTWHFTTETTLITGTITFQVDMSREIRLGRLTTGDVVGLRGETAPLTWTATTPLTDPDGDGVYSGSLSFTLAPATSLTYQFVHHQSDGSRLIWEFGTQSSGRRTLPFNGDAALPLAYWSDVTGVAIDDEMGMPTGFALHPNYPNPFNPTTEIAFDLPRSARVRVAVFNLLGREVAMLLDGVLPAGRHAAIFGASGLPSGTYVYRLEAEGYSETRRLLLVK